jgi:uncharacterized membrane protein
MRTFHNMWAPLVLFGLVTGCGVDGVQAPEPLALHHSTAVNTPPMAPGYGPAVLLGEIDGMTHSWSEIAAGGDLVVGLIQFPGKASFNAVMWNGGVATLLPAGSATYTYPRAASAYGIAGSASSVTSTSAVVWRAGQMEELPKGASAYAEAYGMNDAGEVVGHIGGGAVLWRNGGFEGIEGVIGAKKISNAGDILGQQTSTRAAILRRTGSGYTAETFEPLTGDSYTLAVNMNLSGTLLYSSCCASGRRFVLVKDGAHTAFGGNSYYEDWSGVNRHGHVAGIVADAAGSYVAAVWKDGRVFARDAPAGAMGWAWDIGDDGVVVGGLDYYDAHGNYLHQRAAAWYPVGVSFPFSGFLRPVEGLPTLNVVKAGSAVPIKFSLGGDRGLGVLAGVPLSQSIVCDSNAPVDVVQEAAAAGASGLSYDAGTDQYTYVWKTDKGWGGGCRQFLLSLSDGTTHRANFRFNR